jgi:two-component system, chemotaxis family, sensor kinase CheA
MNAMLEQFVLEARELVNEASDELLALERLPGDQQRIDVVFRAFHTLKGGAAIADLPDMTQLLHVGEDLLSALRGRKLPCTSDIINALLACVDQVGHWLADIEATGRLPDLAAERAAVLAADLRRFLPRSSAETAVRADSEFDWAAPIIADDPALSAKAGHGAIVAIAYDPQPNCFFDGDDPLGLLRKVPQLVFLDVRARSPWPDLQEVNPFACNLAFRALTLASRHDVGQVFRYIPDQVRIAEIARESASSAVARERSSRDLARKILAAQRTLLAAPCPEKEFFGRLGAAIEVAKNVLRFAGAEGGAARIEAVRAEATSARNADVVLRVLDQLLSSAASDWSKADSVHDTEGAPAGDLPAIRTLRIEEAKVDRLLDVAGELIVAKNTMNDLAARIGAELGEGEIARAVRNQTAVIDRLVGQTHHSAVQLRMVPLAQAFRRLPRVVRDVSHELGKQAAITMKGEDTEADKSVVDAIFEPLLHVLRNALDHGIETPEERRSAGKPEQAEISLSAFRHGEHIVIELGDDGRGVDAAAVRRKAREQSLISDEEARELSDDQAIQLMFAEGLSTAAQVSQVSGRGVGLAAVRATVERLGGAVSVASQSGRGTTVRLALPLSMAFMRIMTIHAGGEVFGVPIEAIAETVRLPRAHILQIKSGEAFVLRDRIVPTCRLDRLLELPNAVTRDRGDDALILVTDAGGQTAGLEIDSIGERLDVVVKPMQGLLAEVQDYAGTTMLGNGRVLLVLNLGAVLQ